MRAHVGFEEGVANEKVVNKLSFNLSIICLFLFLIVSFLIPIREPVMGHHPLNLILYLTLITFVLGLIGFLGIQDWKGMARSAATIVITLGLSLVLAAVLFFGSLLS
jgi:peptidoglycan/LPS O-acetylase OafA/YrhL